jgi:hypothetical protein
MDADGDGRKTAWPMDSSSYDTSLGFKDATWQRAQLLWLQRAPKLTTTLLKPIWIIHSFWDLGHVGVEPMSVEEQPVRLRQEVRAQPSTTIIKITL